MYFPLCCEGKEQMRRKYSCSRALLPSVQLEHMRGETDAEREIQEENMGGWGGARGEEESYKWRGKALCYLKICLERARANSLKL